LFSSFKTASLINKEFSRTEHIETNFFTKHSASSWGKKPQAFLSPSCRTVFRKIDFPLRVFFASQHAMIRCIQCVLLYIYILVGRPTTLCTSFDTRFPVTTLTTLAKHIRFKTNDLGTSRLVRSSRDG
jgi:hypothetical protein